MTPDPRYLHHHQVPPFVGGNLMKAGSVGLRLPVLNFVFCFWSQGFSIAMADLKLSLLTRLASNSDLSASAFLVLE